MSYYSINWAKALSDLQTKQELLVEAQKHYEFTLQASDRARVRDLQKSIWVSFSARALAVRQVSTNSGNKTPGPDGILWDSPTKRWEAIQILKVLAEKPADYRASPVQRASISKADGKKLRPLGIPNMIDRAVQTLAIYSTDPIVEERSDSSSYGFRKGRNAHDAMAKIRHLLDKDWSPQYVLDADIEACFDRIQHAFLLEHTPILYPEILEQWLQAGTLEGEIFKATSEGTPQGGPISPMLCNIALNSLEDTVKKAGLQMLPKTRSPKVNLVRYADDFVVTADCIDRCKGLQDVVSSFLMERGLQLNEEKTQIRSTKEGFTFLGFQVQQLAYDSRKNNKNKSEFRLVITPSHKSIARYKKMVKDGLTNQNQNLLGILRDLNPKLRGWGNYFRCSYHSTRVFDQLTQFTWHAMLKWGMRKHPRRGKGWIIENYTRKSNWYHRHWCYVPPKDSKDSKETPTFLMDVGTFKDIKIFHMKNKVNPYLSADRKYLEERLKKHYGGNREDDVGVREIVARLQGHKCLVCEQSLYEWTPEKVEIHHIVPLKDGGTWKYSNLVVLHETCHKQVTYSPIVAKAVARIRDQQVARSKSPSSNPEKGDSSGSDSESLAPMIFPHDES